MKLWSFQKKFFFLAYHVENIKLVAHERNSSNIVPEMVLCPNIYIYIYIYIYKYIFCILSLKKNHLFVPASFNEMNDLSSSKFFLSSKLT